jgi:hypothetical protein
MQVVRHDQGPAKHILHDEPYVFAFRKIIHILYLRSLQCSSSASLPQFQPRQMVSSWVSRGTRRTTPHEAEVTPAGATLFPHPPVAFCEGRLQPCARFIQSHST